MREAKPEQPEIRSTMIFASAHSRRSADSSSAQPQNRGHLIDSNDTIRRTSPALDRQSSIDSLLYELDLWARSGRADQLSSQEKAATEIRHCILNSRAQLFLHGLQLESLPRVIWQLPHVRHLYLSNNRLRHLPDELAKLDGLTHLTLGCNQFTHIPECLCTLSKLEVLELTNNWIQALPAGLHQLKSLRHLYLDSHAFIEPPQALTQLPAACTIILWHAENRAPSPPKRERFTFPGQPEGPVVLR